MVGLLITNFATAICRRMPLPPLRAAHRASAEVLA
jgi:hypothetical protein